MSTHRGCHISYNLDISTELSFHFFVFLETLISESVLFLDKKLIKKYINIFLPYTKILHDEAGEKKAHRYTVSDFFD